MCPRGRVRTLVPLFVNAERARHPMPPLYRMPIVYMTILLLTAAVGLGRWARARPGSPTAAVGASPARPTARAAKPPARIAVIEPPSDGILRTADGLRRKVVVKDLDLVCRASPDEGAPPTG